jgi:YD repeat-containing protein
VSNLVSLADPVGNTTSWTYDGLDRVTAETNALDRKSCHVGMSEL